MTSRTSKKLARRVAVCLAAVLVLAPMAMAQQGNETNDTNNTNDTGQGGGMMDGNETTMLTVYGMDDPTANEYWFEVEGMEGRNPTITLPPGTEVSIHFIVPDSEAATHNLAFGAPIDQATSVIGPGQSEWLNFTTPEEETSGQYWCDPHRTLGMEGPFEISAAGGDTGGDQNQTDGTGDGEEVGGGDETPGFGVVAAVAALGVALFAARGRRRG